MFNGNILRDAIISAANNLTNQKKAVDDLNVFPVPDGDTGTMNLIILHLTVQNCTVIRRGS